MTRFPVLRREHFRALAGAVRDRYEQNMVAYLRATFPSWIADRPEVDLITFIRESARRAERYQITSEGGAAIFCELEVRFGVGFEKHDEPAGMRLVLEDPALPGHGKAEWLMQELTENPPSWAGGSAGGVSGGLSSAGPGMNGESAHV